MTKYLIVINPISGSGKAKKYINQIDSFFLSRRLEYKIVLTEYHGHAIKIVQDYEDYYDVIICAGGDGTVNEIVNGFNFNLDKTFAVLPIGSGNDYASNLNLAKEINSLLEQIINPNGKFIYSDVISIRFKENNIWKEKLSLNAVGIGFDAYVAYLNQHNKRISGIISYIFAVFKGLKNLKAINFKLHIDKREVKGNFVVVTIGNGKTSGGGFYLNPMASINDEILNITTIDKVTKLRLLKELPKALINKLDKVKEASFYVGNSIRIEFDEPYFVHSDGEILGTEVNEMEIKLYNHKLKTIVG